MCFLVGVAASFSCAQENPYFVTYDHHLEEAGTLSIETFTTMGFPKASESETVEAPERGQRFYSAPYLEIEYGITNELTTSLYLEGQSTRGDSSVFTGWRWEGRFRPMKKDHLINPVLYLEFENLNDASRIVKDVVGEGPDLDDANDELRVVKVHELETKLILSSDIHHWNLAGNFTVDKNLSVGEGFEFGYAFGFAKPLANPASLIQCRFCRHRFVAGLEFYGGLGSTVAGLEFRETSQYIAPSVSWHLGPSTVRFSTAVGLSHESSRALFRIGYSYEIHGLGKADKDLH